MDSHNYTLRTHARQSSYTQTHTVEGDKNQYSALKISKDHIDWDEYEIKKSNYLVQPSIVRPTSGKSYLVAFFRDRRAEHVYTASSTDEG